MTREEAIEHFKEQLDIFGGEHAEAIKVAIEALQNKSRPFGDCSKCIHTYGTLGCCTTVSNEWVYDCEHGMEQYKNTSVPSAGRPRGEWIEETSWKYKKGGRNSDMKEILGTEWMTMIRQRCSECNKVTMVDGSILYKYCPHCGADMRPTERSEE